MVDGLFGADDGRRFDSRIVFVVDIDHDIRRAYEGRGRVFLTFGFEKRTARASGQRRSLFGAPRWRWLGKPGDVERGLVQPDPDG